MLKEWNQVTEDVEIYQSRGLKTVFHNAIVSYNKQYK